MGSSLSGRSTQQIFMAQGTMYSSLQCMLIVAGLYNSNLLGVLAGLLLPQLHDCIATSLL